MIKLNIQLFAEDPEKDPQEQVYLDQIADLKKQMDENMISKEDYDKLLKEHKKLLNDYVNRRPVPPKEEDKLRPAVEIAKEIASIKNGDISNREYVKKSLEYRESFLAATGKDPFTDFTKGGPSAPTEDSKLVADTLKKLVEENESPIDFRIRLNAILEDDPALAARIRKRA